MRKYVKPDLVYENFELSHNVANCGAALNHGETQMGCSIKEIGGISLGDDTVFTAGVNCKYDSDIYEGLCKFTGDDAYNVFTS